MCNNMVVFLLLDGLIMNGKERGKNKKMKILFSQNLF